MNFTLLLMLNSGAFEAFDETPLTLTFNEFLLVKPVEWLIKGCLDNNAPDDFPLECDSTIC